MSLIKVVSLDAFGTLIYPRIPVSHCYAQFAWEACGIFLSNASVEQNFFNVYREMCKKYPNFGTFDGMNSKIWWNKLIGRTFGLCMHKNYFEVSQSATDRLYDWYGTGEAWEVYPGTFHGLQNLKSNKIKLTALSNFDERLPGILYSLNLDSYFDKIVYSSALPFWKPDNRIFKHICELFKISPRHLLHCGDSFEKDYMAAINFGCQALIIVTKSSTVSGYRDSTADKNIDSKHVIFSLEDLYNYVTKVNQIN